MRKEKLCRDTKEVRVEIELNIDGRGKHDIDTGIEFLDHMLSLFSFHGSFDLKVKARGDIGVDIHHTNEDVAIALGDIFRKILNKKKSIKRFGYSFVCMDDALVRCVVDISGRPYFKIKPKNFRCYKVFYSYSHFKHFLKSFSDHFRINLHLDVIEGEDLHHILEASFKALGLALAEALKIDRKKNLPTTKGKID